jgi:hypothetical protein
MVTTKITNTVKTVAVIVTSKKNTAKKKILLITQIPTTESII